jgi:hypothetical protein
LVRVAKVEFPDYPQDEEWPLTALKRALDPDDVWSWPEFIERGLRLEGDPTPEFAEAFIEGAQEFFEEVEGEI